LVISTGHGGKIDEVFKIRNYLAHYSAPSRRSLDRMYELSYNIKRFQEPGRFLLVRNGKRLWSYFDAFAGASADMKLDVLLRDDPAYVGRSQRSVPQVET
jgi:hypothetical protein